MMALCRAGQAPPPPHIQSLHPPEQLQRPKRTAQRSATRQNRTHTNATQRNATTTCPKGRTFCRAETDATRTRRRCARGHRPSRHLLDMSMGGWQYRPGTGAWACRPRTLRKTGVPGFEFGGFGGVFAFFRLLFKKCEKFLPPKMQNERYFQRFEPGTTAVPVMHHTDHSDSSSCTYRPFLW